MVCLGIFFGQELLIRRDKEATPTLLSRESYFSCLTGRYVVQQEVDLHARWEGSGAFAVMSAQNFNGLEGQDGHGVSWDHRTVG